MKSFEVQVKQAAFFIGIFALMVIGGVTFSGCGSSQGPLGFVTMGEPCTNPPDAIQTVVNAYNENLVAQGSDPIQPGLRCTLYNVPNMPSTPCLNSSSISGCNQLSSSSGYVSVATWTYNGTIDQADQVGTSGSNLLPTALQGLYSQNFAVICTGYFVNTDYNYHEFDLDSDDGSLLYLNGSLVLNNDGEHSSADVKGEKYLEAQVYSFQLNYFQGPGYTQLILNEDGSVANAASFYH